LKQFDSDLNVVVLEKGSEVGAHILSGAVLDPSGLDTFDPGLESQRRAVECTRQRRQFLCLGRGGPNPFPNAVMPPLMNNHGNYIVSMGNVCRWMAEQAEALGVEIFPGMSCSELVYGDNGEVKGVVAGVFGLEADGTIGPDTEPGMELHGKYVFVRRGAWITGKRDDCKI
jgi:electron-transferring-flavoprotein dehydrogenase